MIHIYFVFWTIGTVGVVWGLFLTSLKKFIFNINIKNGFNIFGGTLFTFPFVVGEIICIYFLAKYSTIYDVLLIILNVILYFIALEAIKARTKVGRKIQDQIESFKMFLKTTDKEKIKRKHKKMPKVLDIYEKYLPYAIALGIEGAWTRKFSEEIQKAKAADPNYSPRWYNGTTSFSSSSFGSGLSSSLGSSISSASHAPGSSSGGGGSGGGGGGGGGGGW